MLTTPSLIWTVQPGLKHENPSAISLMVCEPVDPDAAERSPPWWSWDRVRGPFPASGAAMMANHHTRGPFVSLFSHPNTLQTAKPVTVQHQGSVVCQHSAADKDREGRILSPGEHIALSAERVFEREKCVRKDTERVLNVSFLSDSSQTENTHAARKRRKYIRAPRRLPVDEKWRWIPAPLSSNWAASRASARGPFALFRGEEGYHKPGWLRSVWDEKLGQRFGIWFCDAHRERPTNKQRGDLTAQNKLLLFETVGVWGRSIEGDFHLFPANDPPPKIYIFLDFHCLLGNLFANWATGDKELCKVSVKFVKLNTNMCFKLRTIPRHRGAEDQTATQGELVIIRLHWTTLMY